MSESFEQFYCYVEAGKDLLGDGGENTSPGGGAVIVDDRIGKIRILESPVLFA